MTTSITNMGKTPNSKHPKKEKEKGYGKLRGADHPLKPFLGISAVVVQIVPQ